MGVQNRPPTSFDLSSLPFPVSLLFAGVLHRRISTEQACAPRIYPTHTRRGIESNTEAARTV